MRSASSGGGPEAEKRPRLDGMIRRRSYREAKKINDIIPPYGQLSVRHTEEGKPETVHIQ